MGVRRCAVRPGYRRRTHSGLSESLAVLTVLAVVWQPPRRGGTSGRLRALGRRPGPRQTSTFPSISADPRRTLSQRPSTAHRTSSNTMFRIKICGITTPTDGHLVDQAGADAIGLNFYPDSPRYVPPSRAELIVRELPDDLCRVGLFVNAEVEVVLDAADRLRLDMIQLHGDESPEYFAQLQQRRVIAGRRCPDGFGSLRTFLEACRSLDSLPEAVLIDGYRRGHYGGTGQTADWQAVSTLESQLGEVRLILAGGLVPENVSEAIRRVRPDAVDTASGVERSPGVKDPERLHAFVAAARAAFSESSSRGAPSD